MTRSGFISPPLLSALLPAGCVPSRRSGTESEGAAAATPRCCRAAGGAGTGLVRSHGAKLSGRRGKAERREGYCQRRGEATSCRGRDVPGAGSVFAAEGKRKSGNEVLHPSTTAAARAVLARAVSQLIPVSPCACLKPGSRLPGSHQTRGPPSERCEANPRLAEHRELEAGERARLPRPWHTSPKPPNPRAPEVRHQRRHWKNRSPYHIPETPRRQLRPSQCTPRPGIAVSL